MKIPTELEKTLRHPDCVKHNPGDVFQIGRDQLLIHKIQYGRYQCIWIVSNNEPCWKELNITIIDVTLEWYRVIGYDSRHE